MPACSPVNKNWHNRVESCLVLALCHWHTIAACMQEWEISVHQWSGDYLAKLSEPARQLSDMLKAATAPSTA